MYTRAIYYVVPIAMVTGVYTYTFDGAVNQMSHLTTNTSAPAQQPVCLPNEHNGASNTSPAAMFPTLKENLSPSQSKKNPVTRLFPEVDAEQSSCTSKHETCPKTHVSKMPNQQYFKTLATAMGAANRRYFVPEIRALINADHATFISGFRPDRKSPFWQAHVSSKDPHKVLITPHTQAAREIGLEYLSRQRDSAHAHRVAEWFTGGTQHDSKAPLDDYNGITNKALGSTLGTKYHGIPKLNTIYLGLPELKQSPDTVVTVYYDSDNSNSEIIRAKDKDIEKINKNIHRSVYGFPLRKLFDTCAYTWHVYTTTPPEAIPSKEEKELQSTCSRQEVIQRLRNYARERYKHSAGTNPQYQKELKAMIDSDEPDQVLINNNIRT